MALYTPNLGLAKPEYEEAADIAVLNANFDKLDGITAPQVVASLTDTFDDSGYTIPTCTYVGWVTIHAIANESGAKCVLHCGPLYASGIGLAEDDDIYLSLPVKAGQNIAVTGSGLKDTSSIAVYEYVAPVADPQEPEEE